MGHFVGVYTAELPTLRSVVGSRSADHFASVLQACGGKFDHQPQVHARIAAALKGILAGVYPSGKHEEGGYYVYAFERLCRAFACKWTVQEIYVDEERFPAMCSFVWGAVKNEEDLPLLDDDNPFSLPTADFGPVCWHRPLKLVQREIERLSSLDDEEGAALGGTEYREEVAAILEVLRVAEQTNQGVFVTFQE